MSTKNITGSEEFSNYVEAVLKGLVDEPDKLSVDLTESEKSVIITVSLPTNQVGQVMGKRKRMKLALETIFWGATGAILNNVKKIHMDYIETDKGN